MSIDDAVREVAPDSPLIAISEHGGALRWVVLREASRGAVRIEESGRSGRRRSRWVKGEELGELLGTSPGDPYPWWIVEPMQSPAGLELASPEAAKSPVARLLALVRPEWREIRAVIAFAAAMGLLRLAAPITVEALVNVVAFGGLLQPLVVLALILMSCLGLAAVVQVMQTWVVELLQRRVFVSIVSDLADRLPRVRLSALDRGHGPELVNRFFDVVLIQKVGSKLLVDGITALLSAAIGLLVLAFYHPMLLAFDVALVAVLVALILPLGRGAVRTSLAESTTKYQIAAWLQEVALHPHAFRTGRGADLARNRAEDLSNAYLDNRGSHFKIVLRQLIATLALQVVASTVLLGLGGWLVKTGELTLGQLVASWLIVSTVVAAITKLGQQLEGWYDLLTSVYKLGTLFDLPVDDPGPGEPPPAVGGASLAAVGVVADCDQSVRVHPFTVQLRPRSTLSISVPPGLSMMPLAETLAGIRSPAVGCLELDGVDLRSFDAGAVRSLIALACGPEVVTGTIVENVRMGRHELTIEEIQAVLDRVGLGGAVRALPQGLQTQLTASGRPLSADQLARLAIARAAATPQRLVVLCALLDLFTVEQAKELLDVVAGTGAAIVVTTRRADIAAIAEQRVALRLAEAIDEEVTK